MENFIPDKLLEILSISAVFSVILMALIQKIKLTTIIKKEWQIWIVNLLLSFLFGTFFAISFYNLDIISGIWVSVFSFIGAPTIYDLLKSQNIINYTPKSLDDKIVEIDTANEIKRS